MNEQETIDDIIAEKRLRAAEMEKTLGDQHSFVESLKNDADRIEAAWKRELSKMCPKTGGDFGQLGDCAKLREALVVARKVIKAMGGYWATETLPIIDAALAAPPRNCDRYSHDEALQVWASEKGNGHNGCFDEWLYEAAKEGVAR